MEVPIKFSNADKIIIATGMESLEDEAEELEIVQMNFSILEILTKLEMCYTL